MTQYAAADISMDLFAIGVGDYIYVWYCSNECSTVV